MSKPTTLRLQGKRFAGTLTATLFAVLTLSLLHVPQAVAAPAFDLYDLRSPGLRVDSGGCRYVTILARTDAPSWVEDVDADVDIWRNGRYVDTVWLTESPGTQNLRGRWYYCPNLDGLGTYRLGDTEVTYYDENYDSHTFVDRSRGQMTVKQATRARFSATRTGKTRNFRAAPQFYSVSSGRWYNFPTGTPVNLQRQLADGSWEWLREGRVNRRGVVTFAWKAERPRVYRLASGATARTWETRSRELFL